MIFFFKLRDDVKNIMTTVGGKVHDLGEGMRRITFSATPFARATAEPVRSPTSSPNSVSPGSTSPSTGAGASRYQRGAATAQQPRAAQQARPAAVSRNKFARPVGREGETEDAPRSPEGREASAMTYSPPPAQAPQANREVYELREMVAGLNARAAATEHDIGTLARDVSVAQRHTAGKLDELLSMFHSLADSRDAAREKEKEAAGNKRQREAATSAAPAPAAAPISSAALAAPTVPAPKQ